MNSFKSRLLNKEVELIIITPTSYSIKNKYSAIYILPGYSESNTLFYSRLSKEVWQSYSNQFNSILVFIDNDLDSWYVNSTLKPNHKYNSYITHEVLPFIELNYSTINNKMNRAICGFSMGGHGAILQASLYPNKFGLVGSISGVTNLYEVKDKWNIKELLEGDDIKLNSVYYVAKFVESKLMLICGKEDYLYDMNIQFHNKLIELNIEHEFDVFDGNHTYEFWTEHIYKLFLYFNNFFINKTIYN